MHKEIEKVLVYITRIRENQTQVLVFEHEGMPEAGIQVPAGTVDSLESLEDDALREVQEETGLKFIETPKFLGRIRWYREDRNEFHLRNIYHLESDGSLKDKWLHEVSGQGEDSKMIFKVYWMDLKKAEGSLAVEQGKYLHLISL